MATVQIQPEAKTLFVDDSFTASAVARDGDGNAITGTTVHWSLETGIVADVDNSGTVTAIAAGSDLLIAEIDGVQGTAVVTVDPRVPSPTSLPMAWPLDRMKSADSLLSQDFDERNAASAGSHTGIDIRADKGTSVIAAAGGWLALIQENQAPHDRGMGNTVVLGHSLADGIRYTQYSHLDDGAIDTALEERAAESSACSTDAGSGRTTCEDGAVWVGARAKLGEAGGTGNGEMGYWDVHLHFEVKLCPYIGASVDSDGACSSTDAWGYFDGDPRNAGFLDPVTYLESVRQEEPPFGRVTPTVDGLGASLRMGPGGHVGGNIDGQYRAINQLGDGDMFLVVARADQPSGLSAPSNCSQGWYQLRLADTTQRFADAKEQNPGKHGNGEIGDAWVCRGNDGVSYVGPPADTSAPTAPSGLLLSAVAEDRIDAWWDPASDDVGVEEYRVFRDGNLIRTASAAQISDSGLSPNGSYCYEVSAVDFAGNESPRSGQVCETLGATGLDVSLRAVIDSTTPIPEAGGTFGFVREASIDGDLIAFIGGATSFGNKGIYALQGQSGTLRKIADATTRHPNRPAHSIGAFNAVAADGPRVIFSTGRGGIFVDDGSSISVIADGSTPIPGGDDNFISFDDVAATNLGVAFLADLGIYRSSSGVLTAVADGNTNVPGTSSTFSRLLLADLTMDGDAIGFTGVSSSLQTSGVYVSKGKSLSVVADHTPGGPSDFGAVAVDGDRIVYKEVQAEGGPRLMSLQDDVRDVIVDATSLSPGDPGNVVEVFADSGRVAFKARYANNDTLGLYIEQSGTFTKVLDAEDLVDGRQFDDFTLAGLGGDTLLIIIEWSVGSSSLYRADLREN